jgi:cholesterol transport system auxiliary component
MRAGAVLRLGAAAAAATALLAAGCAPLLAPRGPAPTSFVWTDTGRSAPAAQPAPVALLLAPTQTASFSDTQRIVFSRTPGTRAYYQLAQWTDRPGPRFDVLLLERFSQRRAFAQVTPMTSGTRGDALLAVTILDIYHDDSRPPGTVRLEVSAELTDRGGRALLARRTFVREQQVAAESAEAAVAGFDAAVTSLLDELLPWVEAEAARATPSRRP